MPRELAGFKAVGRDLSPMEKYREALAEKYAGKAETTLVSNEVCLLLDRTGSMWGRPLELLNAAVRDFKGIKRFSYADDITEVHEGQEIVNASGGNNEPTAFRYLKAHGFKHVIIVTDGVPDYPVESLSAAKGLKIDVIYIGPPPEPEFLRRLAASTGGTYNRTEIQVTKALTAVIRGFLPVGDEGGSIPSKGAICL